MPSSHVTGGRGAAGPGAVPDNTAYGVLLLLGATDAAAYSVIGPVLPALAAAEHAGPAVLGLLASTFPVAMLAGFGVAAGLVRRGRALGSLVGSFALLGLGALAFVVSTDLPTLFAARAVMGLGSGGLWIGVIFRTLAYWPGQEYRCLSRIYAAYSVGGLVGPALGGLGGVSRPFTAYLLLLAVAAAGLALLPRTTSAPTPRSDPAMLRLPRFWLAAFGIMFAMLAIGAVDGALPLHFATRLSQGQIGLLYTATALLIAGASAAAGHRRPTWMLGTGVVGVAAGLALAGAATTPWPWLAALALIGVGTGTAQTGATGILLDAVPTERIVTALVIWSQMGILGYLAGPAAGGLLAQRLGYAALGWLAVLAALPLTAAGWLAHRR